MLTLQEAPPAAVRPTANANPLIPVTRSRSYSIKTTANILCLWTMDRSGETRLQSWVESSGNIKNPSKAIANCQKTATRCFGDELIKLRLRAHSFREWVSEYATRSSAGDDTAAAAHYHFNVCKLIRVLPVSSSGFAIAIICCQSSFEQTKQTDSRPSNVYCTTKRGRWKLLAHPLHKNEVMWQLFGKDAAKHARFRWLLWSGWIPIGATRCDATEGTIVVPSNRDRMHLPTGWLTKTIQKSLNHLSWGVTLR